MFPRFLALAMLLCSAFSARAEEVPVTPAERKVEPEPAPATAAPDASGAWIDLRQISSTKPKPQSAPPWVRAVSLLPAQRKEGVAPKTIFRIELAQPHPDLGVVSFRLFFDDKQDQRPRLLASDNDGGLVLQTPPLGLGVNVPTSETVMVPAAGVSLIEVEVPGNGGNIRAAYLDWMKTGEVLRPATGEQRYVLPETFSAASPLRAPAQDTETFGTVTASLAPETIRIGSSTPEAAAFQFPIETLPLVALITFEVANADVDSPPEIIFNGSNLGPVTLALPDLADPGYRGETKALLKQMRFQYTGWVRAQKVVPATALRVGDNDLLVIGGPETGPAAIRATQIQLKYIWEKLDYRLVPAR